ncbi:hypothetical protein LBMAG31_05380 [Nitrosomonadaceae bacterium]|nr:exosortase system-associated protein, TIGR04073 family [Nitrosospira sp.]MBI0412717.1 exosortase system-associated protein, TIGR04073 family [Nitrosospira sp.]GDX59662.1 hypothetical protein LBMAG31_05380 [Nitrosomonadaceae bacterium]
MKKIIKSLLIVSSLIFLTPSVHAHDASYVTHVGNKLGYGIANIATGWVEVPKNIMIVGQRDGVVAGAITGVFTGVFQMVGRTAYGIMETATFLIPTHPIVKPGYIWDNFDKETSYHK